MVRQAVVPDAANLYAAVLFVTDSAARHTGVRVHRTLALTDAIGAEGGGSCPLAGRGAGRWSPGGTNVDDRQHPDSIADYGSSAEVNLNLQRGAPPRAGRVSRS
jgi:hypothetical protein